MARKYSVEEFRVRLLAVADKKKLGKAVMGPLRRGQQQIAGELISHYWQHKLGRIIWEWRKEAFGIKSGPMVHTKKRHRTRWSQSESAYIAPIHISGLAAVVEEGGNLQKHVIFGRAERRPGVVVTRRSALNRIVDREWPNIVRSAETEFMAFVERTL